jgi:hypothetical protein
MSQNPHEQFDQAVLDLIEHSPVGAVPATPAYQDALARLRSTHQVYASADHKGGYVTVRSLAQLPLFLAENLEAFAAGRIAADALESNGSIFDRYVRSLPVAHRARAESLRVVVAGKPAHHRAKQIGDLKVVAHEPLHTLVLVPGTGPHPGLPGNYLYGSALQLSADDASPWALFLHDGDDGAARCEFPTREAAFAKLQEVRMSAPFSLDELEALDFRLN